MPEDRSLRSQLRDVWAHLTLLASGQPTPYSNAEAASLMADVYETVTGESVALDMGEEGTKKALVTTVEIMLDVENEHEMADALHAILTESMRKYVGYSSCLLDWNFVDRHNLISREVTLPEGWEPE